MGLVTPLKRLGRGLAFWSTGDVLAPAFGGTGAATASANQVFAGPSSGAAAAPGFRALANADIVAGLGYQPARPTSTAQSTGANATNLGVGPGSPTQLATVNFVATAPAVRVDGRGVFACANATGETVVAYCSITGIASGAGQGLPVNSGGGPKQICADYVYTGLTPGTTYTANFYAYQGDNSFAVTTTYPEVTVVNA